MTPLLNGLLLILAAVGAVRMAFRERTLGWLLMSGALIALYVSEARLECEPSLVKSGLLLVGLVCLVHQQSEEAKDIARLKWEVSKTVEELQKAERKLKEPYGEQPGP